MRYLLGMVLLVISIISGCSSHHGHEPINRPESVLVLCDSLSGAGRDGWPEQLQSMAGIPVHKECLGGARLASYELIAQNNPPLPGGTYAVLQLGGWDILAGWSHVNVEQEYSDALDVLYNAGYSPVCYTYPNESAMPRADALKLFNASIIQMCDERGYPVIISSEQIREFIHYTDAGDTETALNAWRVLYPEGF